MSVRRRWALVEVALDPAEGHEQAGSRPALVVRNEPFNETSGLLTVLPITGMKDRRQPQPRLIGRLTDPAFRREVASKVLLHLGFESLDDLADEPSGAQP